MPTSFHCLGLPSPVFFSTNHALSSFVWLLCSSLLSSRVNHEGSTSFTRFRMFDCLTTSLTKEQGVIMHYDFERIKIFSIWFSHKQGFCRLIFKPFYSLFNTWMCPPKYRVILTVTVRIVNCYYSSILCWVINSNFYISVTWIFDMHNNCAKMSLNLCTNVDKVKSTLHLQFSPWTATFISIIHWLKIC